MDTIWSEAFLYKTLEGSNKVSVLDIVKGSVTAWWTQAYPNILVVEISMEHITTCGTGCEICKACRNASAGMVGPLYVSTAMCKPDAIRKTIKIVDKVIDDLRLVVSRKYTHADSTILESISG